MGKLGKYTNGIERLLHGEKGQRFFNFAYSIGAAIVIWGALFKILHLPGGSTLLCIGMGTEIAMFILTAFDRPPKEYAWEDVFPVLDSHNPEDRPDLAGGGGSGIIIAGGSGNAAGAGNVDGSFDSSVSSGGTTIIGGGGVISGGVVGGGGFVGGGNGNVVSGGDGGVVSGGGFVGGGVNTLQGDVALASSALSLTDEQQESIQASVNRLAEASEQISKMAELADVTKNYLDSMSGIADQMTRLQQTTESLNSVSEVLLNSYKAITDNSESVSASSAGYVDRLEDLNRNIGGLNTIYEIQLKSISSQLESIDRVNRGLKDIRDMYEKSANESSRYCEETEKMARYMKQLNQVYEKMITAMTINLSNPMMGGGASTQQTNPFADHD